MPHYRATFIVEYRAKDYDEALDQTNAMQAAIEVSIPAHVTLKNDEVEILDTPTQPDESGS